MVICHSSEPVKSWKPSARKRRLVTRLSDSHENRSPTAQLAQRPTEKSGAILTRVRVPGGARDLSPSHLSIQTLLRYSHSPRVICLPVTFQYRLSYGIRTAPVWFVSQSPFNTDSLTVFAQPPCDLSPSHLSIQTLLRYSHSPRVICLPVTFQYRLSYGIRTAPVWFVSQSPFNADSLTVFAQPPCDLSPSHLSMQTLLRYSHSPRVICLPVTFQYRLSYDIRTAPVWFVSQSPFNADSLTVFAQPPCAIACINICEHVQKPKHWQPYSSVWTHHNTAHTDSNG